MEELKLLIEAVAGLPTITLWVLVGYLIYKLAVIGSVYGVIRYGIEKFVEWRTTPPPPPPPEIKEYSLRGIAISDDVAHRLERQVARLKRNNLSYIHLDDVERFEKILDTGLKENP